MIVFINGRFLTQKVTGVQRYARELVSALDKLVPELGFPDVRVLCPVGSDCPHYENIKISVVGRWSGHLWEQVELPRHASGGCLVCLGNTAPLISLLSQPCVVTVHSLAFRYFPTAYSRAFRALYAVLTPAIMAKSARVITVSESEANSIRKAYPTVAGRLAVIQNGALSDAGLELLQSSNEKKMGFPYGLYVGSLSRAKNFPALLSAAITFVERTPFGFVFIGGSGGTILTIQATIPQRLAGRILFIGQVDDGAELLAWYKGATFFAFPSLYEASPIPPLEAMAADLPVLASDIPALVERCGDAAIYCTPEDEHDIANKMIMIATDALLRTDLIAKGRQRAATFNWKACARATWATILSAVAYKEQKEFRPRN